SIIVGNSVLDGGMSEGSIIIKGAERGVSSAPNGYGNIVANNNVQFSTEHLYKGITIRTSDCLVQGNYVENAINGIFCNVPNGVNITGNYIYNALKGIVVHADVTAVDLNTFSITSNVIRESGDPGTANGIGIQIDSERGTINRVVIFGNLIDVVEASGTANGIRIVYPENISNVTIENNLIHSVDKAISAGATGGTLTNVLTTGNIFDTIASTVVESGIYGGTGSKINNNIGFVTENGGTSAAIASGATIAHGCDITPTTVSVLPA
ncbi:unnamed protein product, partial [marine sediment metagenome]